MNDPRTEHPEPKLIAEPMDFVDSEALTEEELQLFLVSLRVRSDSTEPLENHPAVAAFLANGDLNNLAAVRKLEAMLRDVRVDKR